MRKLFNLSRYNDQNSNIAKANLFVLMAASLFTFNGCVTGLWMVPVSPTGIVDGVKDMANAARSLVGNGQQYEIDGEIVTAEQVKAQAYKYKPGDPGKTEMVETAKTKNTVTEGEQKALSVDVAKQEKEPKDSQEAESSQKITGMTPH
ncbi:MAG: hypothetical protein A4E57_02486 [Syntrophorhabdaceae bacterium PtaU1.Bin034]|nr:MAG: hypothetical protein A4E57_02486 [Syntrophorhabdaceae bacterium PtaU1.Bin034]